MNHVAFEETAIFHLVLHLVADISVIIELFLLLDVGVFLLEGEALGTVHRRVVQTLGLDGRSVQRCAVAKCLSLINRDLRLCCSCCGEHIRSQLRSVIQFVWRLVDRKLIWRASTIDDCGDFRVHQMRVSLNLQIGFRFR